MSHPTDQSTSQTFLIRRKGERRFAEVTVFDTREAFIERTGHSDALAVTRPVMVLNFSRGSERKGMQFAELFLLRDHLGTGLLAHESFHLLAAYLQHRGEPLSLPTQDPDADCMTGDGEEYAYILGDIARALVSALYEHKLL